MDHLHGTEGVVQTDRRRQGHREVPEGRILDEDARTITAGYEYLGGLFRNRMLRGSAVILRPVIGKKDTYHVDKWVRGLGLGE